MLRIRPRRAGDAADVADVDADVAPADDPLALGLDGVREQLLELTPALRLVREEADADPILSRRRQGLREHAPEERVRQLQQDAGTVARIGIGAGSPAVLEIPERDDRAPDRLVAGDRVEAGDECDTTGIVLVRRVVEANGTGRSQVASSSSVFGVDTPRKIRTPKPELAQRRTSPRPFASKTKATAGPPEGQPSATATCIFEVMLLYIWKR